MSSANSSYDRHLVSKLNRGSLSVFAPLDERYRQRLIALVEREMNRRLRRREDPEDIVQLVLASFFRRAQDRQYHFEHPGALWNLLSQIAHRKLLKRVKYHGAARRNIGKEAYLDSQRAFGRSPSDAEIDALGGALSRVLTAIRVPDPKIALLQLCGYSLEEIRSRMAEELRPPGPEIFDHWVQGCRVTDIAKSVEISRARVRYAIERIEVTLKQWLGEDEGG